MSHPFLPARPGHWRASALAAAALLGSPLAWGICINNTSHAQAPAAGDVCTAWFSSYTNHANTLLADMGGKLTVNGDVSFTPGSVLASGASIVNSRRAGSQITVTGNLTMQQWGDTGSFGLMALSGGEISVAGTTNVTLDSYGGGLDRSAVYARDANSKIQLGGAVTIDGTDAGRPKGLESGNGGTITYPSATLNFTGQDGAIGIYQTGPAGDVVGSGDTAITLQGNGSTGVYADNGPIHINGKLTVNSDSSIALNTDSAAGQITIGAASQISATAGGTAVRIEGGHATPLVAGAGLTIALPATSGTAFHTINTAAASTTLAGATVTAQTLWSAIGSDYTFTAQGGTYTGKSSGNQHFSLNLGNAAIWNLNADSALGKMELSGNAVLRPDQSRTLTASDAAGVKNTGGIIDLKDATPATGDVLTIAGNYAGGGKLKLDVNLASGGNHAIGLDADALKVNGNVTGSTEIEFTQLPGTAVATTGNGILIAEISGTSSANAFRLPSPVISGGFQYTLHQVGNRWYLQSSPYTGANVASVPTLSHLGLLLTGGLLAGAAARARRRQKKA